MQTLIDWAKEDGIDVPTFVNDGGANKNWVSGKGAPDIYGFDAYPQGFDCKDPDTWKNLPDYSYVNEWKPESPLIIPEAQGGAFDPWGGTGYQDCAKLTGTDFTRVFSKMNIAAGVSGQSFYMTYGGTNWGWLADPNAVYTSYDYGAPINESRQLTDKYQEFKRLGYMVNSVASLARTDKAEAPAPSDDALRIDRRVNPDDGTQFFTVRHADTRVKDKDETTLSLKGADGDYPRVPQQGEISVDGRDAKLLVAGYDLSESQRLVYSTSEIMTHARIGDRDVALLYGREGEAGETVLRYAERPEVTVLDGEVTTTWDAERGDLRLNYTHKGMARVLVNGLELLIADTAETAHWWRQDTAAGPVLVRGPSLVRTAELAGSTLKLTGDSTKAAKIEVIADTKKAKKMTWNGRTVAVTQAPRPVRLPELTTWKYKEEAPESAPDFDDSTWTTADHLTANNPELAGSLPVLAMDEYGYHHGNVWYRGRFKTTGRATALALNANTGPTGQYAVWLNGSYLGSSGDGAHTFGIPSGTLKAEGDNVLSVLVENAGHNEEWGHDYSKEPRGLLGAEVVGGASTLTWKIQGSRGGEDPVDTARGPYNNGGLYGERAGWSLPGFPDGGWKSTTLPGQSGKTGPGVRWYRTSARLDLPQGQDNAIALDLAEAEGGSTGYRAQIFVNGWLIGRYLPDTGPQTRFVIPKGILREQGDNTIALAVWSTEADAGPGSAKLVDLGASAGGDRRTPRRRALVQRQDVRHAGLGRPCHRRRRAVPWHRHRRQGPRHPQRAEGRADRPERQAGAEGPGRLDLDHRRHHTLRPGPARRHGDRHLHRDPARRPGPLRRPVRDRQAHTARPSGHRHGCTGRAGAAAGAVRRRLCQRPDPGQGGQRLGPGGEGRLQRRVRGGRRADALGSVAPRTTRASACTRTARSGSISAAAAPASPPSPGWTTRSATTAASPSR